MSDPKVLTTLSDAAYLNAPEYKDHVEAVLASYDHPTGILGELVSQMADAFWWVEDLPRRKEPPCGERDDGSHHYQIVIRSRLQRSLGPVARNPGQGSVGSVADYP